MKNEVQIMRDPASSCESTYIYASLASACEAPFYASYASSHANFYATNALNILGDFKIALPPPMTSELVLKFEY